MRLEDWIDPRHLKPAAQAAYATAFASVPYSSIVLDDFVRMEKFRALQQVFTTEGRFEERHYLWQWDEEGKHEEAVPLETWRAAAEHEKAFVERVFVGARPNCRIAPGIAVHFKFVELLASAELMGFLEAVTGVRPATLSGLLTRIMVGGQYIPPHSDFMPIRDLCGVFYASTGWQPTFGGRFRHCAPGPEIVAIEPRPNRLLLFQPRSECRHDVEPITEAGANWERWSYSIWFGTPSAALAVS